MLSSLGNCSNLYSYIKLGDTVRRIRRVCHEAEHQHVEHQDFPWNCEGHLHIPFAPPRATITPSLRHENTTCFVWHRVVVNIPPHLPSVQPQESMSSGISKCKTCKNEAYRYMKKMHPPVTPRTPRIGSTAPAYTHPPVPGYYPLSTSQNPSPREDPRDHHPGAKSPNTIRL